MASWVERPVRSAGGSNRLNPLPHAGTISVFLLAVVVLTGVYITLFFQYGYDASYESVADMEGHPIQRVARAVHRYASAMLVVTTVVHAWRMFVSGRFTGRRRQWRWVTGVAALVTVWLAGVTGYWLVWDQRAQALTEAYGRLASSLGLTGVAGWTELAAPETSGATPLLIIWFAHLALTAVIGYALWRHLRRSQLSWLPPRHWMVLMGAALVVVSVALPVGMLAPADPTALTADLPLDPFVLFLLPPLLSDWALAAALVAVAAVVAVTVVPWLSRRRQTAVVEISAEDCTGCELCVIDCPYLALTMSSSTPAVSEDGGDHRSHGIAVLDADACVGCGICLGSCNFGAISLPGLPAVEPVDVAGRAVAIVCDRHLAANPIDQLVERSDDGPGLEVLPVRCAGSFNPMAIGALARQGAERVQMIGCAPGDCRYGIGNTLAAERVGGERKPHLARRWSELVDEDWVATGQLRDALTHPGSHPAVDANSLPGGRERLIGAGLVVALSVVAVGFATRAPFRAPDDVAAIRVVVDHEPGRALSGLDDDDALTTAGPVDLEITVDGENVSAGQLSDGTSRIETVVDTEIEVGDDGGSRRIEVVLVEGGDRRSVFDEEVDLSPGRRVVVTARDAPLVSNAASEGERVFNDRTLGACNVCHSVRPGDDGVGPSLAGIGTNAADRVPGLDAAGYIRQSIYLPDQYVVEGYPAGQMLPIYRDRLSEEELEALIAYLLTLTEEEP